MNLLGQKLLVIGSHTVDALLTHDVEEIGIFDNLSRRSVSNLEQALKDRRGRVFAYGGDILDLLVSRRGALTLRSAIELP